MIKRSLKFVCISDTHELQNWHKNIPNGDVLIHSGDFTLYGGLTQTKSFIEKFTALPHPVKILIAGNHDLAFDVEHYQRLIEKYSYRKKKDHYTETAMEIKQLILNCKDIIYLEHESVDVFGYKLFGSPFHPIHSGAAFQRDKEELIRLRSQIPSDIDILVTHGPPHGIRDQTKIAWKLGGCENLRAEVEDRIKPKYHIFGHIHEGYGTEKIDQTTYINCAMADTGYTIENSPICFWLPLKKLLPKL